MIRDKLVVGLRDTRLSEKLQMDSQLTLAKVITQVRQSEAVKQRQAVVRNDGGVAGTDHVSVNRIARQGYKKKIPTGPSKHDAKNSNTSCGWFG